MATIKSYTDLSQSKTLSKILPLESADMCYSNDGTAIKIDANPYTVRYSMWKNYVVEIVPCWSLAALLNVVSLSVVSKDASLNSFEDGNWNVMVQQNGKTIYSDANNPVDACVDMIEKLHELKML